MHHPTDRMIHTTVFVTPVVEHWLERDAANGNNVHKAWQRVSSFIFSVDINHITVNKSVSSALLNKTFLSNTHTYTKTHIYTYIHKQSVTDRQTDR